MISEKKWYEKNLSRHFWELSDELLTRIWSVYWCCINSVYVLNKDSLFLKSMLENNKKTDAQESIKKQIVK